ncbi:MAG: hypothetical protein DWI02_10915 [Planctomycetota bacterium]|nr:MAG: hypothetical protein DWI02_10915 [Planctomycetota bacterium]
MSLVTISTHDPDVNEEPHAIHSIFSGNSGPAKPRSDCEVHLYQGRFKSLPIQQDEHFLTVCRHAGVFGAKCDACRRASHYCTHSHPPQFR